eukprot:CAMPEP_0197674094 /NCGR_PEP_ID=MMETSP1338-20131121/82248_1 /TAXON_ID=43686 ORGANISM="Pelagodinium beii, Strain RCC1491" /NCGR_SAMPLE_ID=MMETSP1338 /ASSEMBLY_ACC=CAM_ASM_000754 /LENGTH=62 /DNA_ID=CAMNT_0043254429 /DNA_START=192 /DNA_END=377 /DNA_ORIENTATION=-
MPLFGPSFQPTKVLKPNLKMACQRIAMVCNKKTNAARTHRREIQRLLADRKYEKANIKAEHV